MQKRSNSTDLSQRIRHIGNVTAGIASNARFSRCVKGRQYSVAALWRLWPVVVVVVVLCGAAIPCQASRPTLKWQSAGLLQEIVPEGVRGDSGARSLLQQQAERLPHPPEPPARSLSSQAAASNATAAQQPPAAETTPPAAPPSSPAPPADNQAPWQQRRTLQLPPHVYLISFVMLLAIMAALLSCHCYRMCRIARRMRQAADLGVTVSASGSTLSKRTPQSIIESLPVAKYASIHNKAAKAGQSDEDSKGPSSTAVAQESATAAEPAARMSFVAAAMMFREHLTRQTGISSLGSGSNHSNSASAAACTAAELQLQPPPAAVLAAATDAIPATTTVAGTAGASLSRTCSGRSNTDRQDVSAAVRQQQLLRMNSSGSSCAAADCSPAFAADQSVRAGVAKGSYMGGNDAAAAKSVTVAAGGSSSSGPEPCAICFDEFKDDDDVKQLPCSHYYHCSCIDEWLVRDVTCPLCKAPVLDEELLAQQQRIAVALEATFGNNLGSAVRRGQQQLERLQGRDRRSSRNQRYMDGSDVDGSVSSRYSREGSTRGQNREESGRGGRAASSSSGSREGSMRGNRQPRSGAAGGTSSSNDGAGINGANVAVVQQQQQQSRDSQIMPNTRWVLPQHMGLAMLHLANAGPVVHGSSRRPPRQPGSISSSGATTAASSSRTGDSAPQQGSSDNGTAMAATPPVADFEMGVISTSH